MTDSATAGSTAEPGGSVAVQPRAPSDCAPAAED